ncbi:RNA polymerase sigma factor [Luteipulveratus mongoliensis]|uniref:RNA polymerase subunit sigma-24 n=1 Tax=Luteipulveratus mongoliensis TaxID=571913 RepID=A0A0K1JFE2_9MICO|nr:sigma-70 family RNA polymerase sigma factor [Luteipulveratus mongoliensis]AKU15310.1 RNA polymerase subunit sigma-24 [Luteipulveratus mongoliensis]
MLDSSDPRWVDPDVVRAAQRGDTLALNEVLDRLTPYVERVCGPIALDSGSDAAQDTLIAVMRALPTLRDPVALVGWVRAIAVREAVRHARRDARHRGSSDDLLERVPAPGDPTLAADVRDVLERLTPEHRAVLVLRDLEGFDEAATAEVLNLPEGTIKSRLHRARGRFRKEWGS